MGRIGKSSLEKSASEIATPYRLDSSGRLCSIGTFDNSVTVLSQQRRALNLAWALIESGQIPTRPDEEPIEIAVVGAGFAGLTFASALLQKRCRCKISLFEERDTLLPLQQGSDTRWLHPHIYDWPDDGSEAAAAMLPVLNWTAARASDVVVQVLSSWKALVNEHRTATLDLYCNTRHLQIHVPADDKILVEWVGERRDTADGNQLNENGGARGLSRSFDLVVLAVGFGLEVGHASYWRNEVLGQPSLTQLRRTYLISGQGDGAMIDLLRLKISQFRQDRILTELFIDKPRLLSALKKLRVEFLDGGPKFPLFDRLDEHCRLPVVGPLMKRVIEQLRSRLRRDTELVLRLKVRNFSELLQSGTSRISFQNAILVYFLYRAGGFSPSSESEADLAVRLAIPPENVIWRNGIDRVAQLRRLLPSSICDPIAKSWKADFCQALQQSPNIHWSGGYFGVPGRLADAGSVTDKERKTWRKEYLPGPTSLIALSLAGAVAAKIRSLRPAASHFRVTVHRVLMIHEEELLQQLCGYVGDGFKEGVSTAGRTFPARNATIGLAYRTRKIVRSRSGITPAELTASMAALQLNEASRVMAKEVGFVAAIPIVQPNKSFLKPSPVCGVVYFDSRDSSFDLDDKELNEISLIIETMIETVRHGGGVPLDRIENTPLRARTSQAPAAERVPKNVAADLVIPSVDPPRTAAAFVLNYDHSDLTPLA